MTTRLTAPTSTNNPPVSGPAPGDQPGSATSGEEVNSMSMFSTRGGAARTDLDRAVVLERVRHRRRAARQARALHSRLWGLRVNR